MGSLPVSSSKNGQASTYVCYALTLSAYLGYFGRKLHRHLQRYRV